MISDNLQFIHQAFTLTRANVKTRYRNSFTGLLWVVLNPVLMFGAQAAIFHFILKLNVVNYPIFLLSGLLPWIFIVQSVEMGTGSFTNNAKFLKSFPIQPGIVLVAQVFDNLINFMITFTAILLPTAYSMDFEWYRLLLLPLCPLPLFVFTFSFVWLLATLQVFFWDTRFVMTFLMGVTYFLTPIIYPIHFLDEKFHFFVGINPLWRVIRPFQEAVTGHAMNDFLQVYSVSWLVAIGMFFVTVTIWKKVRDAVYFKL